MRRIDRTIFNQLASKRAVVLPNVGTLWVEFINAEQGGGASSNKVGFSRDAHDGVRTVIELIHSEGIEYDEAEERYAQWLVESTSEQKLEIEGVGSVTGNNFHVSKELNEVLNPTHSSDDDQEYEEDEEEDNEYDNDKKEYDMDDNYNKRERMGLIVIGLLILILVGGWSWWWYKNAARFADKKEVAVEQVVAQAAEGEKSAEELAWEQETDAARKAREEQKPAIVPMKLFHVVGGVFSTRANADRFIAETKRDFPHAKCNYQIESFKGDKFMVTLHSSETERDAANHRNRLEQEIQNYELWVYKVEPTK